MGWITQAPEVWLASALLIAIGVAIACAFLSHKTDARMIFFFHLIGDDPAGEDLEPRIVETSSVRLKWGT